MSEQTQELLARFTKSREVVFTVGAWTFTALLPTAFEERRMAFAVTHLPEETRWTQWARDVLIGSIIGWSGPTVGDLLGDGDATPLPYSASLVAPLMESRVDVMDALNTQLMAERARRQEKQRAAEKNSLSVSTGN